MNKKSSILNFKADSDSSDSSDLMVEKPKKSFDSDDLFGDSVDEGNNIKEQINDQNQNEKKSKKKQNVEDNDDGFGLLKFGGGENLKSVLGLDEDDDNNDGENSNDGIPNFVNNPEEKQHKKDKKPKKDQNKEPKGSQISEANQMAQENSQPPKLKIKGDKKDEKDSEDEDIFKGVEFKKGESFEQDQSNLEPAKDDVPDDLFSSSGPESEQQTDITGPTNEQPTDITAPIIDQRPSIPLGRLTRMMKEGQNSSEYSYDTNSPPSTEHFQNLKPQSLPGLPPLNPPMPFILPQPNLNTFLPHNPPKLETRDYDQPRVVNWLQFQLPEIPDFNGSVYDQKFESEYSSEKLYLYAKQ